MNGGHQKLTNSQTDLSTSSGAGTRPRVYVASPLGFSEPTRFYYERELLPRLIRAGCSPLDPWADEDGTLGLALGQAATSDLETRREELTRIDGALGRRNVALIEEAEAVLAVLDGPDVDSGTASEIGFAFARGKLIVGLRSDFRLSGENEGCLVNLQVEHFIRASGGTIVRDTDEAIAALADVLGERAWPTKSRVTH